MGNLIQITYVGLGGFLGAIARFLISKASNRLIASFPLGTLLVNVIGSFILGFILYSLFFDRIVSPETRNFLAIGFLGAFTTMSTFSYETMRLFEMQQYFYALLNIVLNIALCFGAIIIGKLLAMMIFR